MASKKQTQKIKNIELVKEMLRDPNVPHKYTNESLKAINQALDPQPSDRVLSICGSAAQPLSSLEHIGRNGVVVAIDYNEYQLQYAQNVLKLIQEGDIGALAKLNISPKDKGYFLDRGRLERIAANRKQLKFHLMNVSKGHDIQRKFNKGYFSNAPVNLAKFHALFEPGAIVYVIPEEGNRPTPRDDFDTFIRIVSATCAYDIRDLYILDKDRTKQAHDIERSQDSYYHASRGMKTYCPWNPCVFVRK